MERPLVKSIVVGSVVWIVVCISGGFVSLARLGEYGSAVQLLISMVMGLLGAASHIVLSVFTRFHRFNFLQRGLLNWLSAYLPIIAIAALLVNFKNAESDPNFWSEMAKLMLFHIGTPMLFLALLVSLITSTKVKPHEV